MKPAKWATNAVRDSSGEKKRMYIATPVSMPTTQQQHQNQLYSSPAFGCRS